MTSYLIVGGSSDIAIVTAKKLLEQGSAVTCLARDESRVEELKSLGAKVVIGDALDKDCLLYTSPSPRDMRRSRMPSSA